MSNWEYAQVVPTQKWRSANTVARELFLEKINNEYLVASKPVEAVNRLKGTEKTMTSVTIDSTLSLIPQKEEIHKTIHINGIYQLDIDEMQANEFTIELSNDKGDLVTIGFDKTKNEYFIDRTTSGITAFNKDFAGRHTAPRFLKSSTINLTLLVDRASVELFADHGLTTMTSIIFPRGPFSQIRIKTTGQKTTVKKIRLKTMD